MGKKRNDLVDEIVETSKTPVPKKKLKGKLSTGADLIDLVIGGGFPFGIINIIGDSSSGKSFLSGEFIAKCYNYFKGEFDWFYDDCEKGYRFNSQKLYGIDILKSGFLNQNRRSNTIEDFERNLNFVLEKKDPKKPFVYVLDSFDSLTTDEEIKYRKKKLKLKVKEEDDEEDASQKEDKTAGSYNLAKQKEGHALFRTKVRALEEGFFILIVVSQVKEKIGVTFGNKYYRTGGKALDFYPNIIFYLAEAEKYKKKNRSVGICIKVKGQKTRNDKPFRECFIDVLFDYGIDNISSNLKFLYDLKVDKGQDKKNINRIMLDWNGVEYLFTDLIKFIEENNAEDELKEKVINKWDEIETEISSDNRKRKWGTPV